MCTPDLPASLLPVAAVGVDTECRTRQISRMVPAEVPVALVVDGATHAVMLASPEDLEDFALGVALNDGIVTRPGEIERIEIIPQATGIEARIWLAPAASARARPHPRTGRTGHGLCAADSLAAALPPVRHVPHALTLNPGEVSHAFAALDAVQPLRHQSHAVHAAGFWEPRIGLIAACEDVSPHNALDKVTGAVERLGVDPARGMVLLTSRVTVELVQKAARLGAPVMAAISAPTALAVATADAAGITLIAVARADGFEVFTHPHRITPGTEPLLLPRGPADLR